MSELSGPEGAGPLAAHVEGVRAELTGLGYSPRTARDHGYVLAQLSRWAPDVPTAVAAASASTA